MKWHTEVRKISELKEWKDNPRTISKENLDELMSSIDDLGNFEPLVIDTDGTVIAGNQRLMVASRLKQEEVEVSVPERKLTGKEIKKIGLISNRHSGEWDMDKLAEGFEDILDELGADDLMSEIVTEVEEDDYEEPDELEVTIVLGDVYQLGEHRLVCGDSTKIEDVEKLMDGQKADMVFTDPPYGIEIVDKKTKKVGAENLAKNQEYSEVIGDDTTDTARDFYNTFVALGYDKFIIWGGNYFVDFLPFSPSWIVWDKRGDMNSNNFADGEMAWCSFHTRVRIYKQIWNGMIREGESEKRVHPTQKPIRVLSDIISEFTKEDESVVDVFGGSGSTLIACEQTNRKCYMMELDPHYCQVIIDRWEKLTNMEVKKL